MGTECTTEQMEFQQLGRRRVIGRFNGGKISSEAGGLLLREVESRFQILKRLARDCFRDYRDKDRIEHTVGSLIRQRVYGIALGYEDLNDHDRLRHDVMMGLLSEKRDPSGKDRVREQDQGKAIAGKSTLNRLELTPEDANKKSRYKKIVADGGKIDGRPGPTFASIDRSVGAESLQSASNCLSVAVAIMLIAPDHTGESISLGLQPSR
jgi:hypothetical protein